MAGPHELTDLLAVGGDEGGYADALVGLLGRNGLRSRKHAARAWVTSLAPLPATLRILGKGDQPAEIPLNPRTYEAIDRALGGRADGPLLLNRWGNRMQRHNAAAIISRLARTVGLTKRVTPHALRRSYITIGLLQGVPLREMQRAVQPRGHHGRLGCGF